mmetsp:Transcript_211/g.423  ORF Transcript_211/g.423 Transcript_211/m.423 type:complete len:914 (-) Transcript_211:997-3738(-)
MVALHALVADEADLDIHVDLALAVLGLHRHVVGLPHDDAQLELLGRRRLDVEHGHLPRLLGRHHLHPQLDLPHRHSRKGRVQRAHLDGLELHVAPLGVEPAVLEVNGRGADEVARADVVGVEDADLEVARARDGGGELVRRVVVGVEVGLDLAVRVADDLARELDLGVRVRAAVEVHRRQVVGAEQVEAHADRVRGEELRHVHGQRRRRHVLLNDAHVALELAARLLAREDAVAAAEERELHDRVGVLVRVLELVVDGLAAHHVLGRVELAVVEEVGHLGRHALGGGERLGREALGLGLGRFLLLLGALGALLDRVLGMGRLDHLEVLAPRHLVREGDGARGHERLAQHVAAGQRAHVAHAQRHRRREELVLGQLHLHLVRHEIVGVVGRRVGRHLGRLARLGVAHVQLDEGRGERDAHGAQAEGVAQRAQEGQRRHVAKADDGELDRRVDGLGQQVGRHRAGLLAVGHHGDRGEHLAAHVAGRLEHELGPHGRGRRVAAHEHGLRERQVEAADEVVAAQFVVVVDEHGDGRRELERLGHADVFDDGLVPRGVARGVLDARLERLAVVLDDDVRVAQAVLVLGGEEARHVEVEAHLVLLLLPLDELAAAARLGHVGVRTERDGAEEEARDVPRLEKVQAGLLDELQPLGHVVAAVDLRLGECEQLHGRPAQVGDVLAAAHDVDENVGELRPALARGAFLNGGEHELHVVHGLVEEGAAVAHVLGLRVGLDLADADLDLHALAEAKEAAAAVVEGHVRGLVEVAAQRVARLGDLLVGHLAQGQVVEAARLLLLRHELAQVVALGVGHHVLEDGGQRAVDGQVVRAAPSPCEVNARPDAHQQPAAEEGAGPAAVVHRVGDERRAHPSGVVGLGRRAVEVDPVGEEVCDDGRAVGAGNLILERLEGEADGTDGVVG